MNDSSSLAFKTLSYCIACIAAALALIVVPARGETFTTLHVIGDEDPATDDRGRANTNINSVPIKLNALTTVGSRQFVSYYLGDGKLVVGRRQIGAPTWELFRTEFTSFNINDDHNISSIGIDGDGILHMSWGMHGHNFLYTRSSTSVLNSNPIQMVGGDIGNSAAPNSMTGLYDTGVTYPAFYNLPDGDLLFMYRNGGSGSGDYRLRRYDTATDQWSELGGGPSQIWLGRQQPGSGLPDVNAYPNQLAFDFQGNIHATWTWRTGGGSPTGEVGYQTNHHISYARSADGGATWTKMDGTPYSLPIYEPAAEIAVNLPEGSSLINTTGMAVDALDQPVVASWWAPNAAQGDHRRQYMFAWYDKLADQWRTSQVSHRTIDSLEKNPEANVRDLGRPIVVVDDQNRAIVAYRDNQDSNGLTIAYSQSPNRDDWQTIDLTTENLGNWEPTYDINRWNQDRVLSFLYQPSGLGLTSAPVSVLEWDSRAFFTDVNAAKLTLSVDRVTGGISIRNGSGEMIDIDGYSIHSPSGSLDVGSWLSLQDQGIGSWQESSASSTRLNELSPSGSLSFDSSVAIELGSPFAQIATTLPAALAQEDITFEYTTATGDIRNGIVEYTGHGNLVLVVNPLTGDAVLQNSSRFDVGFEAYTIVSDSGSLLASDGNWNSLSDQNAAGGDWHEASVSENRLSELKFAGAFQFERDGQFELGQLFDAAGGSRDLKFEFLLHEGEEALKGIVVYLIPGDFNQDGSVDAADYVVWRNSHGTPIEYALWRANFGRSDISQTLSHATIPEPASVLFFALAVTSIVTARRSAETW